MQENTLQTGLRNPERRPMLGRLAHRRYASLLTLVIVLALWQLVVTLELYPDFIIPPPRAVAERFYQVVLAEPLSQIAPQWLPYEGGRQVEFWRHVGTTLQEVLAGLVIGVAVGVSFGYAIAKNRFLENLLSPIIVALQSTPVVAYAPLLVIWFGSQWESKVITATLIVFFPMLVNTIVGIRNVPTPLHDLMRSLRASRWQMLVHLEIPAATPVLVAGLRTSVTLAVIGAVVGEFVSANAGLGYLVTVARNQYDTPLVLVAVLTMTTIARVLYSLVSLVERRVMRWQARVQR
jgi:NitT/TauT family transport system permease protein